MQGPDTDRKSDNLTVHIASATAATINNGTNGQFILQNYDAFHDRTISATTGDARPWFGSSTDHFMAVQRAANMTRGQSTLFGYGNWFSSVSLKDCQGTVILRNVLVDGAAGAESDANPASPVLHTNERGFDIENSEVILDNTASIRNYSHG